MVERAGRKTLLFSFCEVEMVCDLHTHSVFSDGSYTPTELIKEAKRLRLSAVALTDHNTTKGLPEFFAAAKENSVTAVAGTELSTDYGDTELHILGLFLPEAAYGKIEERVQVLKRNKEESNRILCKRLALAGYEISFEEVQKTSPTGFVNRALIGAVLTEKGYTSSIQNAFDTLLKKGGQFYVEPKRPSALETVAFLKDLGAAVVLAHPFLNVDEKGLRKFLDEAVERGLDGIETRYSTYTKEQTALSEKIAEEYGLLKSGGSDFHGSRKPGIALGVGRGDLAVPTEFYQKLKERAR